MADRLAEFKFTPNVGSSFASKYPWHEWTDGTIWKITRGSDYDTKSMVATLKKVAKDRELVLEYNMLRETGGEAIVFRYSRPEPAARATDPTPATDGVDPSEVIGAKI